MSFAIDNNVGHKKKTAAPKDCRSYHVYLYSYPIRYKYSMVFAENQDTISAVLRQQP